ncbi:MAG: NACHT domain-containing protein, partial [Flavobacteriaceae bacterium]
ASVGNKLKNMIDINDTIAVKDMISAASPLIKSLVETFVTPKLEEFRKKYDKIDEQYFIPTDEHFREYYHRTYKKLAVVNTLVFNNSQRFLKDIYLPLTISSTNDRKIKYKLSGFPEEAVHEYGNILITDTAGMGKSTLMKKVFIDAIEKNIGIPIIVELRRLSKDKKLIDEIQEQLNSLDKDFDSKILLELLVEGGFIIILDGYDEISLSDRDIVTSDIQDFINKASNNEFFITSRPEKALLSFGNFQEFKIEPLNKKEAFELLRKYDNQGQISSLLIKKLQETDMSNIQEFLTNPLLVSLLFTAFEHKQAIPFKKYLFYRQVYDANFESHDLTKGDSYTHDKYSKLEIDDFHRVLRHLGYSCFKLQKIEFIKDDLLKLIKESREFCVGLEFNESDFLNDILRTVPLFTQDGNYFRWSHKSLQEYFAAQFIYLDSKGKQNTILEILYNHSDLEKFINVLDLYYDMDYKTFRNVIERSLLLEFKNHTEKKYIKNYKEVPVELIDNRQELTFLTTSLIFTPGNDKEAGHPFNHSRLSDMIGEYRERKKLNEKSFSGILVTPELLKNQYTIHYENRKSSILKLLATKKNKIVERIPREQLRDNKLNFTYPFDNNYELVEIKDTISSIFNSKSNFEVINHLISATKSYSVKIKKQEGLSVLQEIESNIENENSDDFLIKGI